MEIIANTKENKRVSLWFDNIKEAKKNNPGLHDFRVRGN